ncbi:MAG: hypothetical protein KatS3mg110_1976 [Pirellulaceae bacterium]|nr:MAG: hypothetical protein KatS3mg110_1976 [Pirellulaceae bacterium]
MHMGSDCAAEIPRIAAEERPGCIIGEPVEGCRLRYFARNVGRTQRTVMALPSLRVDRTMRDRIVHRLAQPAVRLHTTFAFVKFGLRVDVKRSEGQLRGIPV